MDTPRQLTQDPVLLMSHEQVGSTLVVHLTGDVDVYTATPLLRAIQELEAQESRDLVLDLTHVPFLDSSGVRIVVKLYRQLAPRSRTLRAVVAEAPLQRLWQRLQLHQIIPSFTTLDSALPRHDTCTH